MSSASTIVDAEDKTAAKPAVARDDHVAPPATATAPAAPRAVYNPLKPAVLRAAAVATAAPKAAMPTEKVLVFP